MAAIPNEYRDEVCRFGRKEDTCAFLTAGSLRDGGFGFECAKGTVVETAIRARLALGTMTAKGDHCTGYDQQLLVSA